MIREQVYTITETAKLLGVNRVTIRRWIKAGKLHAENIGGVVLIPKWEVELLKTKKGV